MSYNKYYPAIQDDESGHFYPTFTEDSCDIIVDITELSAEFQADFASIMTNHTNSIYTGTDLTGTGTNIPYVIPSSLGGDLYVNVETWNVYKAVATSVWDYVGNIKGAKGDTGSTGATGNGISSAVLNGDYTLTLNFTDGTSYTTTSIRGAKGDTGETGATGNGISSIVQNADNTLTITMTDGTTYTTSPVKGDKGDTGTAATIAVGTVTKGENASVTNTGTSSAAVFDFTLPKGDKGDTGSTGATGNGIASITKTGTVGLVDTYTITFTNGTTTTFTVTNGEDGAGQVESVNGKTGVVVLDADDVGALPDDYVAPVTSVNGMTGDVTVASGVQSVNGQTGNVTLDADDVGALPDDTVIPQGTVTSVQVQATSPVQSSTSTAQSTSLNTTISLANGYGDTKNPYGSKTANQVLAAPNGSNGTPSFRSLAKADLPTLTASDVGAMPDSYVAPVTSVNGQTGTVSLDADDVGALPDDTSIPSATSDLQNDSGFVSSQQTEKIFVQGTTPSTASDGDIWIDTATQSASGIAYLPLSAGSSHHITGDLYVDEDIVHPDGLFVKGEGTGKVYVSSSTPSSPAQGDIWIDPDGAWQGDNYGTVYEGTLVSASASAGTSAEVYKISNLGQGTYIVSGQVRVPFSSSYSAMAPQITIKTSTTTVAYKTIIVPAGSQTIVMQMTQLVVLPSTDYIAVGVYAPVAFSGMSGFVRAVKLV